MLYKHSCNNEIYLSVPFMLVSTFGISSRGVHLYGGTLQVETSNKNLVFYCPHCGVLKDLSEVESYCYECRQFHNLKDLYYNQENGSTLCLDCAKELDVNSKLLIPILTVLSKRGE